MYFEWGMWKGGDCAPVVWKALTGCTLSEACEQLSYLNIRSGVQSRGWRQLLKRHGGVEVSVERPDGEKRLKEAWQRFDVREQEFHEGGRWEVPRYPSWIAAYRYTVAQFLKIHNKGTWVLGISGHTLLARDGEVVADNLPTKSKRGRVRYAYLMT